LSVQQQVQAMQIPRARGGESGVYITLNEIDSVFRARAGVDRGHGCML